MRIKKFFTALLVLALSGIFIVLGNWQLTRAQQMNKKDVQVIDQSITPLQDFTSPFGELNPDKVGHYVSASGHYIANFKAPNQVDGTGKRSDWEVALFQTDTASAILVVRGLWSERFASPEIVMATEVSVNAILMPHQNDDLAENTPSQISRLDSSVLTGATDLQLYDGFLILTSETSRAGTVDRVRVLPPKLVRGVPGFYWQHISYVVIWWFMALLVLWAPFYRRRGKPDVAPKLSANGLD